MTDLERYRDEIDEIDSEIVRLFEKRMKVSEEVAEYKIKTGKQVLDPARESQKIHTLKEKAHGDFNSLGVQELFRQIMAISRKRQYQLLTEHGIYGERNFTTVKHVPLENATVVFQGVEGAYSYAAMRQYFGKNIESYHVKTWRTAMEDVTHGKADYAVLPIENSTAGIVADIYDLLMEYKLYIVGEQIIRVDHVLLGMPDATVEDIREVCSHPQGLAQWMGADFPDIILRGLPSARHFWRKTLPGKRRKWKTPQAQPKRSAKWEIKVWQPSQAVRQARYSALRSLRKTSAGKKQTPHASSL